MKLKLDFFMRLIRSFFATGKGMGMIFIFSFSCASAQDLHYSQYYASPLNLSPANTGQFNGDLRFAGNHKSQWSSISTPFKSLSASLDGHLFGKEGKSGALNAGIIINRDKAGDSEWGLFQASGSLSYSMQVDAGKNFVTLGLQGGFAQRSIDFSKLIFDEQYDGDAYNPSLSNGETFSNTGYSYTDFSGGLNWNYRGSSTFSSVLGLGLMHVNEPKLASLLDNSAIALSRKYQIHARVRWGIGKQTDLIPLALYASQGKYKEKLYGANLRFGFEPKYGFENAFYLGVQNRIKDAIICIVGMEYRNFNVGFSYDINTSKLKTASNSRGGLEVSVIYIFKKVPKLDGPKKPCPDYL